MRLRKYSEYYCYWMSDPIPLTSSSDIEDHNRSGLNVTCSWMRGAMCIHWLKDLVEITWVSRVISIWSKTWGPCLNYLICLRILTKSSDFILLPESVLLTIEYLCTLLRLWLWFDDQIDASPRYQVMIGQTLVCELGHQIQTQITIDQFVHKLGLMASDISLKLKPLHHRLLEWPMRFH